MEFQQSPSLFSFFLSGEKKTLVSLNICLHQSQCHWDSFTDKHFCVTQYIFICYHFVKKKMFQLLYQLECGLFSSIYGGYGLLSLPNDLILQAMRQSHSHIFCIPLKRFSYTPLKGLFYYGVHPTQSVSHITVFLLTGWLPLQLYAKVVIMEAIY